MRFGSYYKNRFIQYAQKQLQKYPAVNYWQRVWRHRNDTHFVEQIMRINHDPDIFRISTYGEKNAGKNIYLISVEAGCGLCGSLTLTLHALSIADRLGLIPVIEYRPETCIYAEKEEIFGTRNAFEYYFEQPGGVSLEEARCSKNVFLYNTAHELRAGADLRGGDSFERVSYAVDNIYLGKLARLFEKYIRLNEVSYDAIYRDMSQLSLNKGERILGVHIRGTDYALNWNNHPNIIGVDEFITTIDSALEQYGYEYIFLATDDENRLNTMYKRYGNRLLFYENVHRGTGSVGVHEENIDRPNNRYLNGLEVIRDIYTLANCQGFICGLSQVSFMTRIIRLSQGVPYDFVKVLDNGIYRA